MSASSCLRTYCRHIILTSLPRSSGSYVSVWCPDMHSPPAGIQLRPMFWLFLKWCVNNFVLSFLLFLTRQFQSRVLKGAIYTQDFCSVFHRSTSCLNTGPGSWGGTEKRVLILLVGMEHNSGVNHLTKHLPVYFW